MATTTPVYLKDGALPEEHLVDPSMIHFKNKDEDDSSPLPGVRIYDFILCRSRTARPESQLVPRQIVGYHLVDNRVELVLRRANYLVEYGSSPGEPQDAIVLAPKDLVYVLNPRDVDIYPAVVRSADVAIAANTVFIKFCAIPKADVPGGVVLSNPHFKSSSSTQIRSWASDEEDPAFVQLPGWTKGGISSSSPPSHDRPGYHVVPCYHHIVAMAGPSQNIPPKFKRVRDMSNIIDAYVGDAIVWEELEADMMAYFANLRKG
jgi:hypothetical protein